MARLKKTDLAADKPTESKRRASRGAAESQASKRILKTYKILPEELSLLDAAAKHQRRSRTQFMLAYALEAAADVMKAPPALNHPR